mmetsp:Transcript_52397/g.126805  ORF Transcript_52397/g.126805 Transcript_52397/m.126805 type:complete len:99 (+) Transcript_52397:82-378(+)
MDLPQRAATENLNTPLQGGNIQQQDRKIFHDGRCSVQVLPIIIWFLDGEADATPNTRYYRLMVLDNKFCTSSCEPQSIPSYTMFLWRRDASPTILLYH